MNKPLDIKNDNLWKLMWNMSLPGIIATIVISLNTFIDSLYIGYFIGADALAGISLVIPLTIIVTAVMVLIASGSASVLSRAIGAENTTIQQKVLSNLFTMSVIASALLMPIGFFFSDELISLMGGTGKVLHYGSDFYKIWSFGIFFTLFGLSANGLIRAEGKIKQAMRFSVIAVVLNIVLAPILINFVNLGIKGVALASIIAMAVYAFLTLHYFLSGKASFATGKIQFKIEAEMLKNVFTIGLSAFFIQGTNFIRQVFIFKSVAYYGTDWDLAFFSTVFRIFTFSVMPVFGLLQVLQPVVGINYGAGNYERCVKAVGIFRAGGILFLLLIWIPFMLFPATIVSVMLPDKVFSVQEINYFRTILCIIPFFPIGTSGIVFFQAIGKGKKSSFISIGRELILFIPLILILPSHYGVSGIYYSIVIENFLYVILLFILTSYEFKKMRILTNNLV
ncbi:Mate efflux family protein [Flavobacterium psychrophilum]|uniref:MATE family efflux transporter n=1 Tax=Flavobacterium psychrophilum TaxID=96345 RepID=UPI000B7C30C3|nr:MATE family efflux transporter [Flavobacterium psychrophilum]SNB43836.1 Mate efflux family protein [Flavobacterium psychrophilum]